MALFQYKALQLDGKMAEGQIDASGRADAFRQIEERGLKPVNLSEKGAGSAASNGDSSAAVKTGFNFGAGKGSAEGVGDFTRLLSSLLAAGVPLSRALVILYKESGSPVAGAKWKQVYD